MEERLASELLLKPLDQIYFELGATHFDLESMAAIGPLRPNDLIEIGKKYFFEFFNKIKKDLCESESIQKYIIKNESLDDIHIVSLIFAELSKIEWIIVAHIPLLSVVIFKRGLKHVCSQ